MRIRNKITFLSLFFTIPLFSQNNVSKDSVKSIELKDVVINNRKKAIEYKADRVIYNFSEQAYLNSGSLMDGLKKIPGLIISDVTGMIYQGKQLEVYMDGRPLNMYSDELNSFIESLPANSVEKIEIITQPGAEFPATSGGAIINILSAKNSNKHFSATYSNGFSFSKYNETRPRFNNSILINSKNKFFGWQIQLGQNYASNFQNSVLRNDSLLLSNSFNNRINRLYFIKTGAKFDLEKDRLLINYEMNSTNNSSNITGEGYNFSTLDESKTKIFRNDFNLIYQKRFENKSRKLDFNINYNNKENSFNLNTNNQNTAVLENNSEQKFYQLKIDYSDDLSFLDKTKVSVGVLNDQLNFKTESFNVINLNYKRSTWSAYAKLQTTYKRFDLILGSRLESYSIDGKTSDNNLIPFNQTRWYPNFTVQYNLIDDVFINLNYNKKIILPNVSSLNPNNTYYQNQNVIYYGNPNLRPTILNNYEIKLSAMEYFTIGYSISEANNQIINRISNNSNSNIEFISENVSKVYVHNFNFGLPIPFMLFTKGLQKTLEFDFNPDKINFIYLYADYQRFDIEHLKTKGFWTMNAMMQIILPYEINFTTNFNTSSRNGNYYYYQMNKPFNKQLDISFSKKFLKNDLSASIYLYDIFNNNNRNLSAIGTDVNYFFNSDSRRIGMSLIYKIPLNNKSNKMEENLLKEIDEESYDNLIK